MLFVGITRAKEELQLSYAGRRMIRGNLKLRIASEFLLELPRNDMEIVSPRTIAPPAPSPEMVRADDVRQDAGWTEEVYEVRTKEVAAPLEARRAALVTASQLLEAKASAGPTSQPTLSPETFQSGMIIRHPSHGMGKIVSISGTGARRTATIQFFNATRPAKFILTHTKLEVVGEP